MEKLMLPRGPPPGGRRRGARIPMGCGGGMLALEWQAEPRYVPSYHAGGSSADGTQNSPGCWDGINSQRSFL